METQLPHQITEADEEGQCQGSVTHMAFTTSTGVVMCAICSGDVVEMVLTLAYWLFSYRLQSQIQSINAFVKTGRKKLVYLQSTISQQKLAYPILRYAPSSSGFFSDDSISYKNWFVCTYNSRKRSEIIQSRQPECRFGKNDNTNLVPPVRYCFRPKSNRTAASHIFGAASV